ncbi:aminotransferase [Aliiruegeria lutimaris]|uniref:aspartate transaminase n=1 Tax=Aliiruegeria lutimaris TaxID=571298 RepID=A0A1G8ZEY7_9RHOB|nr:aminotransferase [Aliiruegeria lutimaris]SDK13523.1 Aspartate/methionine/tyrosine aminotransferase [Aliiruegeria lutimaris]
MPLPLNPAMMATDISPVPEAARWVAGVTFPADQPLINVSQAAPVAAPPAPLREAMAQALLEETASHLYGPDLGLPALREALAEQASAQYGGQVSPAQVAITSGCNQAFAAAIATLAGPGDEVLLPTPWYFNHKMWLDMSSIRAVPLPTDDALLPRLDVAGKLITPRTRAIALVCPNNPAGVEYSATLIAGFRDLARKHGLALVIDETYRDFHSSEGAPHDLLTDPDWEDTVIRLYSFSKAYRLTGHRVGAMMSSPARLAEVEKFIDSVTICPSQVGQRGALWGIRNLGDWLAGERQEILVRRRAIEEGFPRLAAKGWRLKGCGAYFAYVEHPFALPSDALAREMVEAAGVLCLPGTMFEPRGEPSGARHLRIAYANIDRAGIATLFDRLESLGLPR